jgi:PKD repeat protein
VSFTNANGGSGGYKYSFDFDNNGTFEITDSANASATVPASYLADGPGSRVVHGRIRDSAGAFTDYTTTITINNVSPSVTLASQFTGTAGAANSFSANVTDPSTADTAAGFTYSWNFGDNSTSTQASPSHTYAAAGTYNVTLKVTDKDGGQTTKTSQAVVSSSGGVTSPNNINIPPLPAPTGTVINVATETALRDAVNNLQSNQTIMIAAGTCTLTDTLYLPQGISNVSIRGATGTAADVVIQGAGMSGAILFGFWVGNVQGVTFGDMTIRNCTDHGIILNAGVQSPLFHDLHIVDMGEQFIKSNPDGNGGGVNNGVVEYCSLEYSTTAPGTYTNGVDVHTGANWIIRNNLFRNFRAPSGLAGPAILMWNGSRDTITENNIFINNQRDIAYGLDANHSTTIRAASSATTSSCTAPAWAATCLSVSSIHPTPRSTTTLSSSTAITPTPSNTVSSIRPASRSRTT